MTRQLPGSNIGLCRAPRWIISRSSIQAYEAFLRRENEYFAECAKPGGVLSLWESRNSALDYGTVWLTSRWRRRPRLCRLLRADPSATGACQIRRAKQDSLGAA